MTSISHDRLAYVVGFCILAGQNNKYHAHLSFKNYSKKTTVLTSGGSGISICQAGVFLEQFWLDVLSDVINY